MSTLVVVGLCKGSLLRSFLSLLLSEVEYVWLFENVEEAGILSRRVGAVASLEAPAEEPLSAAIMARNALCKHDWHCSSESAM